MFSSRLPLAALTEHLRALRQMLDAGITLPKAMRQQAKRGSLAIRPVADRLATSLEQGNDLRKALEDEEHLFPRLFPDLIGVAEHTGKLPEVLGEVEEFFSLQHKLKRDFISKIILPAIQLFVAICILSGLIVLRGFLPAMPDFTGMNLKGVDGALKFLGVFAAFFGLLFAVYWLGGVMNKRQLLDAALLRIPVIGYCLEAFCLSRFCMAFHLTSEAGMPVRKAVRLSLRATGSEAFAETSADVETAIQRGESLQEALAKSGRFPDTFLVILETAEESGQVPEAMRRQAKVYYEEAARRLSMLTTFVARMIYVAVAIFIIWAIARLYMSAYGPVIQMIDEL